MGEQAPNKIRKRRYKRLLEDLRRIMNTYDPIGLIALGAPDDEYDPEVGTIIKRLREATGPGDVARIVDEEFMRWFGEDTVGSWRASVKMGAEIWSAWQTVEGT